MGLQVVSSAQLDDEARQPIEVARSALSAQADALVCMAARLDDRFATAARFILACKGRVVVCGIGKSGLIGTKIVATLASTGTPALFLHPAEAVHGDLGNVTANDVLLVISNSGQTDEVVWLLPHVRELGAPLIALLGKPNSTIGRSADVVLDISVPRESCPHNLAPTTSALATLAMGDALAMAVMRARGFTPDDYARFHPGGTLGRRLTRRVCDVMKEVDLPLASPDVAVEQALLIMSAGRCGLVIAVDEDRRPLGVMTDGDVRRALQQPGETLQSTLADVMTRNPITIAETVSYKEAQERMHRLRLKALIVVDEANRVTGVVEIFDGT